MATAAYWRPIVARVMSYQAVAINWSNWTPTQINSNFTKETRIMLECVNDGLNYVNWKNCYRTTAVAVHTGWIKRLFRNSKRFHEGLKPGETRVYMSKPRVFFKRYYCLRLSWRNIFCRIEDIESLSSEKNRLSQSLDHKTKKVLDLETK